MNSIKIILRIYIELLSVVCFKAIIDLFLIKFVFYCNKFLNQIIHWLFSVKKINCKSEKWLIKKYYILISQSFQKVKINFYWKDKFLLPAFSFCRGGKLPGQCELFLWFLVPNPFYYQLGGRFSPIWLITSKDNKRWEKKWQYQLWR